MSEEIEKKNKKKSEKWERSDWYVIPFDKLPSIRMSQQKARRKAITFGKININDDKFSISEFSLDYTRIVSLNRGGNYYIIIETSDGKSYYLYMITNKNKSREKLYKVFLEKLKQYEKIKMSNAINFLKDIPKLYKEISFDDLISRTGLPRTDLIKILENLISNEELKAEIRGNILKLKKEPEAVASPSGYTSVTSSVQVSEKCEGMSVFVSYATKDAELYKIPELARMLEEYKEIGEVLYWQEDMHDSIIEYMNDNLGSCNGVLLFCSPNALDSVPVKKEWMAAEALKKPIIPIFLKPEHIPPLLSDRLGFEFDNFDLQKNVREIHELLLKKK